MGHRQKYNDSTRVPNEFVTFYCGQIPSLRPDKDSCITFHRSIVYAMHWKKQDDTYKFSCLNQHEDMIVFWDMILRCISDKQSLTVLSYDLVPQLALTDFWRWVDVRDIIFWKQTEPEGDKTKKKWKGSLVLSDPPNYISFRIGSRTIKICDMRNYCSISILELLKAAGYTTHHYSYNPSGPFVSDCAASEIAHSLGVVFGRWLHRWKENDCGVWQPTAARLAMNSFRHALGMKNRYIERKNAAKNIDEWEEVPVPQVYMDDDKERKLFERAAYFSGRAEAFRTGAVKGRAYYVDIRSMYPYLASNLFMPYQFHRRVSCCVPETLLDMFPHMQAIANVTIETDYPIYPTRVDAEGIQKYNYASVVPNLVNKLVEQIVVFPTGRFDTILCGEELRNAVESGHVKRVWSADIYKCALMFQEYFVYWYSERLRAENNGDMVYAQLCKMMMNSLIGKFGQRSSQWEDRPDIKPLKRWGTAIRLSDKEPKAIHERYIAGHTQRLTEPREIEESIPALPAFVCSAGRLMLWQLMNQADMQHVLMCNTDGFAVDQYGKNNLELCNLLGSTEWGTLRITDTADEVWIQDATHYCWGADKVDAGFPSDRTVVHNGCVFGWIKNHVPNHPKEMLPGTFKVKLISPNWKNRYMGRMVKPDGLTQAWRIGNDI